MGLFSKSPEERIRREVAKLRRKGDPLAALKLQVGLCQDQCKEIGDWETLAELADETKQAKLEVTARGQLCKLGRAGVNEWLAVARLAKAADLLDERVDALFRAADWCALHGECQRATKLCDQVLEIAPSHAAAKRIRGVMAARIGAEPGGPASEQPQEPQGQQEPQEKKEPQEPQEPRTHLGLGPAPWEAGESDTSPGVGPPPWESGAAAKSEAAEQLRPDASASPLLVDYVCRQQVWPSVLDSYGLTFTGRTDTIDPELLEGARRVKLPVSSLVCRQGVRGQIIYCVDSGRVQLRRVRGVAQDLGTVSAGEFFGEVGAIAGVPCSATATVEEEAEIRVITRQQLRSELPSGGITSLVQTLRKWYLEAAVRICSPLGLMDEDTRERVTASSRWALFEPGQHLAQQGQSSKLVVIVVGVAQVTREAERLGFLTTGDTVGELDPSPVTVTARTRLFAAVIEAEDVARLPPKAKAFLETRAAVCNQIVGKLKASPGVQRA